MKSGNHKWVQISWRPYLACICLLIFISGPCMAAGEINSKRRLSFYNTHTHERLTVIYRIDGRYIPSALKKIDHVLRDHRADEIHAIDPRLMDFLFGLLAEVNNHGEVLKPIFQL